IFLSKILNLGIDISLQTATCCFLSQEGKFHGKTFDISNNLVGEFESDETGLARKCDKYLRYYLVEAANSLRVHNEQHQIYYQKKYQEVPDHKNKRALVLTARRLVRMVFTLLSKNRLYDPLRVTQHPGCQG
ncbi:MAG: hypothetical protein NC911_11165, partial [Candidatus Omnitrophica bacterium]|nr:hypothetical protein [Candidatus Omnitrophota bacterium]